MERAVVSLNGNKGTFMEIDGETGGRGEIIKDPLEVHDMLRDRPDDNEGVIRVLKDGQRMSSMRVCIRRPSPEA
jgi:hypothetical protein